MSFFNSDACLEMRDDHFMQAALDQAGMALAAGEFPVGCVMVHQGRVIASGSRQGSAAGQANELDHAEMVALRRFIRLPESPAPEQVVVYCTMEPCLMCFSALMLHRIGKVVFAYEDVMGGGTAGDRSCLRPLYRDNCIVVVPHVLRTKSVELFKAFFSNPANGYWRNSLLAQYTLAQ
jgi:tRNA(adenine34) deaminase